MTVSWTDRTGATPARVKVGEPWPADPAEYPLDGPSSGPVYMPPFEQEPEPPLWLCLIGWFLQGCAVGAVILVYIEAFAAMLKR